MIKLNDNVLVWCATLNYGNPKSRLRWFRNNEVKPMSFLSVGLTINSVKRNDTGNYTCKTINVAGEMSKTYELIVFGKCWG